MLKMTLFAAAFVASSLFATEKFYLEPEQISLTGETILVQLSNDMVEVDSLLVDQGGVYMCAEHARCPLCHRSSMMDTPCHKRLNPKNTCHKRLNPKNTCHKRLNPKNTCSIS
ncbi:MAG: hypothetical protein S4CHLAM81_15030 [Chlamydiales bacterium]|nr:hypothetical protein [Chlamydiales bacterium]MCH9636272.1 hypothetical protein [Chlamydiales bacterium]MCH9704066.1 hypothetical protein [Chlamydiota bacterium]